MSADSDGIRLEDTREDVLSEQRLAFQRQVAIIQNLDNKALRTVRISFLLVGALVSAGGLSARNGISVALGTKLYGTLGVIFLLSTIFLGIVTFDTTTYKTRLSQEEYTSLVKPDPPRGDHKVALRKLYREWSENANAAVKRNRKLFAQMQTSFFISIVLIASAGGWLLIQDAFTHVPTGTVVANVSGRTLAKIAAFPAFPVAVLVVIALGTRVSGGLPNVPAAGED